MSEFKAGFVNIIGKPNVGKSTLMNGLVGERLSIITSKSQTTRHRIMGILNGDDFQIIYSDTPGIINKPQYKLQESMNNFVTGSLKDADVILYVVDIFEDIEGQNEFLEKIKSSTAPAFLIINKIDLDKKEELEQIARNWSQLEVFEQIIPVSALEDFNLDGLFKMVMEKIPVHPPYFAVDALTDKPERFFVSEIIREKIFTNYDKEVPYSTEVEVESFREEEDRIYIQAIIYVERDSQKGIIIGKQGSALRRIGTQANKDMETFLAKPIDLRLFVKVRDKWRSNSRDLKGFGYNQK